MKWCMRLANGVTKSLFWKCFPFHFYEKTLLYPVPHIHTNFLNFFCFSVQFHCESFLCFDSLCVVCMLDYILFSYNPCITSICDVWGNCGRKIIPFSPHVCRNVWFYSHKTYFESFVTPKAKPYTYVRRHHHIFLIKIFPIVIVFWKVPDCNDVKVENRKLFHFLYDGMGVLLRSVIFIVYVYHLHTLHYVFEI